MKYSWISRVVSMLQTHRRAFFSIGIALLILIGVLIWKSYEKTSLFREQKTQEAYQEIVSGSPSAAQELFASDVSNGVNDVLTKSNAYLVMERYAYEGNIYEIYDYVDSHPSLAFLREAEERQPEIFRKIKDRSLPVPSVEALYAFLSYVGVLEKYGYANVALRASAAHMYAKNAYILTLEPERFYANINAEQNIQGKTISSLTYLKLASPDIESILMGNMSPESFSSGDIVDGLSQYAAALGYLQYRNVDVFESRNMREIFNFCLRYVREKVPEEEVFISYMYASVLLLDSQSTEEEVRAALNPVLRSELSVLAKTDKNMSALLNAQNEKKSYFAGEKKQRKQYGLFQKSNVSALAKKTPEFRAWLIRSGWQEADFWE